MERSKQPAGVFKGRVIDSRAQRGSLRRSSVEQMLEDEDHIEDVLGYLDRFTTARSKQGARTQPRSMGRDSWDQQD